MSHHLDRTPSQEETENSFSELSLNDGEKGRSVEDLDDSFAAVDLQSSATDLPGHDASHLDTQELRKETNDLAKLSNRTATPTMGADDVLDDLTSSLDSPGKVPARAETPSPSQSRQRETDPGVRARHYSTPESRYEHLFEEVSLDLPRDPNPIAASPTPSKLFKFIARKPSPPASSRSTNLLDDNRFAESNDEISGPFYSISDVLEDRKAVVGPRSGGTMAAPKSASTPGARRGINQNDVIATSGGSSAKALKRRSSLNPFSRPQKQTPSALESVISKTRPVMLPPKNPSEEKKHLQQHENMMKRAKAVEAKKEKQINKKREERNKQVVQATRIWEEEILPNWHTKRQEKRTQDLWVQGLPPRCRGKVWNLAIGNALNIPRETYYMYVKEHPKLPTDVASESTTDDYNYHNGKRLSTSASSVDGNKTINSSKSYHQYSKSGGDLPSSNTHFEPFDRSKLGSASDFSYHKRGRTSSLEVLKSDDNQSVSSKRFSTTASSFSDMEEHENGAVKSFVMERQFVDDEPTNSPYDVLERQASPATESNNGIYNDMLRDGSATSSAFRNDEEMSDINIEQEEDRDSDDSEEVAGDHHNSVERSDFKNGLDRSPDSENEAYNNKVITEDILRTLPSLCVFQVDGPMYAPLREVLRAYTIYRTDVDYIRGTSFLAGMFLLNMDPDKAFISLCNIIQKSPVLSAMFSASENGIRNYAKVFNVLFAENLPKLYLHFRNLALTPNNYLTDWLTTVFASVLPLELSSRLWDVFILHGDIILFKTGLVILKYLEPLLWGGSYGETVRTLNMGFVGEERGEELNAVMAVSGNITQGEQDRFFDEVMGRGSIRVDDSKYAELIRVHLS